VLFHVLGNMLIGVAIGLVGYNAATAGVTGLEQSRLRQELEDFQQAVPGAVESTSTPSGQADGPRFDYGAWEAEDAAYWTGLATGAVFGSIVAPAMNLDSVIVKGVATRDLRNGPGWAPSTDLPFRTGNVGISGHRTTYGAPFRRLDRLAEGDTIDLFSPYRRYRYVVGRQMIVTPDSVEVFSSTEEPTLTLTACHPPFSARYRIVVQARLIDVRRIQDIQSEE
jgi:sortase A